ncbi:hypothetical protein ABFV47_01425 [Mycolicibacterium fortuitum]|uniref:hypothetical protein n=1 Tax=Mycolicibacterium fortuitum TaxID=1766 RepID=UPI003A8B14EE
MIRPQTVVLPILRAALPGVAVLSAPADVEHRSYPLVVVQRAGGTRNPNAPRLHALPVLQITATSDVGPVDAEELYDKALDALYAAVRAQTVVQDVGYLQSISEDQGPTPLDPWIPDAWSIEGRIRCGLRPFAVA